MSLLLSPHHHSSWFDLRVFYVRITSCLLAHSPFSLLVSFPCRHLSAQLEINGGRIPPSERAFLQLRRDRLDTESAQAIYVSTDNIRTTGNLSFEIYDRDDLLVYGTVEMINKGEWSMNCYCAMLSSPSSCCFLRRRADFSAHCPPSMEVYLAGRNAGMPIVLTQTVQLNARRRNMHYTSLDAIPEDDESRSDLALAQQISEDKAYAKMVKHPSHYVASEFCACDDGYLEGEEGQLSWFKAGVRVGVGIGLGMCLGIGIGIGLIIRTYQTTTWQFRRKLI